MSLESTIVHLSAMLESLTVEVIGLRAAMTTLTATAAVEIEARTDRPMIEVLKFGTDDHAAAFEAEGFATGINSPPHPTSSPSGRAKRRDIGLPRTNYPTMTYSSCCGAERRKASKHDGKCVECR
jgi:hypothetical protein